MNWPIRLALCALVILPISALLGCGGASSDPMVIVSGKLFKGGQPLPVDRPDVGLGSVQLTLVPVEAGVADYSTAAQDGTFKFIGAGDGVAPGKYRLAILHYKSGPGTDELKGAFAEDKSPITIDVPAEKAGGKHDVGTIELTEHGVK